MTPIYLLSNFVCGGLPGFRLTRGLITLVNDKHVDNYFKAILASV